MMAFRQPRRPAGLFFVLVFGGLSGCGVLSQPVDVSGKVTYQGKTVVCGTVTLVDATGVAKSGNIGPDGTYLVKSVMPGKTKVAVISLDPARPLNPLGAAGAGTDDAGRAPAAAPAVTDRSNWTEPNVDRSKWSPLPKKYEYVHTSGLTVDLKSGENTGVDLNLQ
ncbi:MAG TPA: hypothetical protein VL371_24785 [Gemmataceae bacterium]|jgi:hypothetical protein|nr:hypothetical protein [Gemmataceae bacterium]